MNSRKVLSREFRDWPSRLRWQQNRFAILLTLLRRRLPLEEYRRLLRILDSSSRVCRGGSPAGDFERLWIREFNNELDGLFARLETDERFHPQLNRLVHLFRDLLAKETGIRK